MSNDPSSTSQQPAEDRISAAFENLLAAFRQNKTPGCMRWNYEMIGKTGSIRTLVREFINAKVQEDHGFKEGEVYHKDQPGINRFKKIPKRKAGFIDAAHNIEYQVSELLNALVLDMEKAPPLEDEARHTIMQSFRALAEVLDDNGLYMNQGKVFANKSTLPLDADEEPGPRLKSVGIFRKLPAGTPEEPSR